MAQHIPTDQPTTKRCAFCTATIPTIARVCRYCNNVLITQPPVTPAPSAPRQPQPIAQRNWLGRLLTRVQRTAVE